MGSGKSSLLNAISFALFGTFPSLEHRKLSLSELIKHKKNDAKIVLGLEWGNFKYEIIRKIWRELKKEKIITDAEIMKDGKLIEKGQLAVTKYIKQLLQTDYSLFSRAIYSEQNNIDYFLNIEPSKRKEEMDYLLGLDKFEIARANTVTIMNRTRSIRKALEDKFSRQMLEDMQKKEEETKTKCEKLEQEKKANSELLEKSREIYREANSKFCELKIKKENTDAIIKEANIVSGAIEQLKEEIAGKEANESLLQIAQEKKTEVETRFLSEKKELLELQDVQNSKAKEAGMLENRLEIAKNAKAESEVLEKEICKILLGKKIEEIIDEKQKLEQEKLRLLALCQSLSAEIKKLEENKVKVSPELSKCPICRNPLTKQGIVHVLQEYDVEIRQKKTDLEIILNKKNENAKLYSQADENVRKLEMLIQKQKLLEKSASQFEEIFKKFSLIKDEIAKLSESISTKRQTVEKSNAFYTQIVFECRQIEELIMKKRKLEKLVETTGKYKMELEKIKFSETEFENSRTELEERKFEIEKLSFKLDSAEKQLSDAKEFLALATAEKDKLEAMEKEIVGLLTLEEELSIYKNALLETQACMRIEVIDAINTVMNTIWQIIYPYNDYKGLKIGTDEKGYWFEVYNEIWRPAELVSGGERASIALTFRIALATILTPNLNLLILDEPTHNLDKEAINGLAHALQHDLPELIEQSFVITHEEGLIGSEFASMYRMNRDKSINGATLFEKI